MTKYQQIALELRRELDAEVYADRLPSEVNLARRFSTTPVTLRKAQELLIAEGRLVKRQPYGTFVVKPRRVTIQVSLLVPLFSAAVMKALQASFSDAFPNLEIQFQTRNDRTVSVSECDLIGIGSLSPIPYPDIAVPFPEQALAAFPASHYFAKAFDVHRIQDRCYALPVLFSPIVLMADRRVLDAEGVTPDPYAMDFALLERLATLARRQGIPLWTHDTVVRLMRALVFSLAEDGRRLRTVSPDPLAARLKSWMPLFAPDLVTQGHPGTPELNGALLSWTCRQAMHDFDVERHRLYALPPSLRHCAGLAGEFLVLNRKSPHRDQALQVALHFLSAPVQSVLGRHGVGVPIRKLTALDCLGSTPWRDDLFLIEADHICANSGEEYEFLHRMEFLTHDLLAGTLPPEAWIALLKREVELAREHHQRQQRFLKKPFSFDGVETVVPFASGNPDSAVDAKPFHTQRGTCKTRPDDTEVVPPMLETLNNRGVGGSGSVPTVSREGF